MLGIVPQDGGRELSSREAVLPLKYLVRGTAFNVHTAARLEPALRVEDCFCVTEDASSYAEAAYHDLVRLTENNSSSRLPSNRQRSGIHRHGVTRYRARRWYTDPHHRILD
jgi:hypothetical protein